MSVVLQQVGMQQACDAYTQTVSYNAVQIDKTREDPLTPLRVVLDARKLTHGGIGVYIRACIEGLTTYCRKEVALTLLGDETQCRQYPWFESLSVIHDTSRAYSYATLFTLHKKLKGYRYDLFHSPHYPLPYGLDKPSVITIHDLIHIEAPQAWYYPLIAKLLLHSALRRAGEVITVSNTTHGALQRTFSKIKAEVIPNSLSHRWWQDEISSAKSIVPEGRYLLAVISTSKPHKGLSDLLAAFREAATRTPHEPHTLIIVGEGITTALSSPSAGAEDVDRIEFRGRVSEAQLRALIFNATWLVVPSRCEGFSYPVAQAKTMGIPVISRPVGSAPDLCGVGDILCRNLSHAALVEAISVALARTSEHTRANKDQESKRVRKLVSVEEGAQRLLAVYRRALQSAAPQTLRGAI